MLPKLLLMCMRQQSSEASVTSTVASAVHVFEFKGLPSPTSDSSQAHSSHSSLVSLDFFHHDLTLAVHIPAPFYPSVFPSVTITLVFDRDGVKYIKYLYLKYLNTFFKVFESISNTVRRKSICICNCI